MLQRRFDTTLDLRKKDSCASTAQICKCNGPPNYGIAPSSSAPDNINRRHEINCCIGIVSDDASRQDELCPRL